MSKKIGSRGNSIDIPREIVIITQIKATVPTAFTVGYHQINASLPR